MIPVQAVQHENQDQQLQGGLTAGQNNANTTSQVLHDESRRLWSDHATYLRLILVTFKAGTSGDNNVTITRALENVAEIANATVPYLGQTVAANLTTLLKTHVMLYNQALVATRSGDMEAYNITVAMLHENAQDIADLLENALRISLGGNQTVPGGNQTVPGGNQTIPSGNQTIPGGNMTVPDGNQTIPGGNQTVPGGNQTTPGGNQTLPGGNQTQMAIIWILNGAGTNTSSLGYSPANATVTMGMNNTVTWINNDTTPHTVTSTNVPAGAQMFDSGIIQPQQNFTYTFTMEGAYQYYCTLHPWMRANVTVMSNQTIPGGNQTIPGGNQTTPSTGNTTLSQYLHRHVELLLQEMNQYMAGDYEAALATFDENRMHLLLLADLLSNALSPITPIPGGQTPDGNQTIPGGNQTIPGGNQTTPGGNQSNRAMVMILMGSGANQDSPGYDPAIITVTVGANNTVTWTNNDTVGHTVTAALVPNGAAMFDSGNIAPGQSYSYTFTLLGTYQYFCKYHPWMQALIVVQ